MLLPQEIIKRFRVEEPLVVQAAPNFRSKPDKKQPAPVCRQKNGDDDKEEGDNNGGKELDCYV
jgi:hypothetical protein